MLAKERSRHNSELGFPEFENLSARAASFYWQKLSGILVEGFCGAIGCPTTAGDAG